MEAYEIIMTPDAADDLTGLRDYIACTLRSPQTALSYIRELRGEIAALSVMPERNRLVDAEPWHTRGLRRIMAKNFCVYYRIDETAGRVYILHVIYARRDQLTVLAQWEETD